MSKDERDRIRDTAKRYHDNIDAISMTTNLEAQDYFEGKALSAQFKFIDLLRVRREHRRGNRA